MPLGARQKKQVDSVDEVINRPQLGAPPHDGVIPRSAQGYYVKFVNIESHSSTMSELPLARKFDDPLLTAKDERHAWVSLKGLETYGSTLGLCAILRANTAT